MEFNRPRPSLANQRKEQPVAAGAADAGPVKPSTRSRKRMPKGKLFGVIAGLVVLAVLVMAAKMFFMGGMLGEGIAKDKQQAVFLTNGQFYFGKLTITPTSYILKQPYFIQNPTSTGTDKEAADAQLQQAQFKLQRVKNVVYGPDDEMRINKDQVLFWQNLSADSKVTSAIKDDKEGKN